MLGFWFYFGLVLGSFGLFVNLCFKTPDIYSGTGLLEGIRQLRCWEFLYLQRYYGTNI